MFTQVLNFPDYSFRRRGKGTGEEIFDEVRKKWVTLNPEEWVRQHLIRYLIHEKGVSPALIAVEKSISYLGMTRRYDLVIYDRSSKPVLLAECKAPQIQLDKSVFDQAALYNTRMGVGIFVVTNGMKTYCCRLDSSSGRWIFLDQIPDFESMIG